MRTKEQTRQYNQTYYTKNKEKLKENSKNYYYDNVERVLNKVKEYRENNREIIKEKGREYYRRKLENRLLNGARARAKKYNLDFDIEVTDIVIPEYCPLLGIKLGVNEGRKSCKNDSPSIDRIDPRKGYLKGNVWVISHKANTMKSNATLAELQIMLKRLTKILESKIKSEL